jgi:hypothetical protein
MLALSHGQNLGCGGCIPRAQFGHIMGLAADGTAAAVTATVADRVAAIRAKMLTIGIPAAVGSGVVTMLTFAGAFGLARTERVWTPAIWLGAATAIGGLISVALAAKAASDVTSEPSETTAATNTATAAAATVQPAQEATLFGFGRYY